MVPLAVDNNEGGANEWTELLVVVVDMGPLARAVEPRFNDRAGMLTPLFIAVEIGGPEKERATSPETELPERVVPSDGTVKPKL